MYYIIIYRWPSCDHNNNYEYKNDCNMPQYDQNSSYEYKNGSNYHYHNDIDYDCCYDDDL